MTQEEILIAKGYLMDANPYCHNRDHRKPCGLWSVACSFFSEKSYEEAYYEFMEGEEGR